MYKVTQIKRFVLDYKLARKRVSHGQLGVLDTADNEASGTHMLYDQVTVRQPCYVQLQATCQQFRAEMAAQNIILSA